MKISPLNMNNYYFDKSYIVDKHDPNHDKRRILHTLMSQIWWFWTPKRVTRRLPKNTPFTRFYGRAMSLRKIAQIVDESIFTQEKHSKSHHLDAFSSKYRPTLTTLRLHKPST